MITILNNSVISDVSENKTVCVNTTFLIAEQPMYGQGKWLQHNDNAQIDDPMSCTTEVSELNYGSNTFCWTVTQGNCMASKETTVYYFGIEGRVLKSNENKCTSDCTTQLTAELRHDSEDIRKEWKNSTGETVSNTNIASNLCEGQYTFIAIDTLNKCMIEWQQEVVSPDRMKIEQEVSNAENCGSCDGYFAFEIEGGTTPYHSTLIEYDKDDNLLNTRVLDLNFASNLCFGKYKLIVFDKNNCPLETDFFIDVDVPQTAQPVLSGDSIPYENSTNYYEIENFTGITNWIVSGAENYELLSDYEAIIEWQNASIGLINVQLKNKCIDTIIKLNVRFAENKHQNYITPNDDGINDFFVITEIAQNNNNYPENELFIYNYNGILVYEQKNYKNNWSGYSNQARFGTKQLKSGIYYYYFRKSKTDKGRNGYVHLFVK